MPGYAVCLEQDWALTCSILCGLQIRVCVHVTWARDADCLSLFVKLYASNIVPVYSEVFLPQLLRVYRVISLHPLVDCLPIEFVRPSLALGEHTRLETRRLQRDIVLMILVSL